MHRYGKSLAQEIIYMDDKNIIKTDIICVWHMEAGLIIRRQDKRFRTTLQQRFMLKNFYYENHMV